MSTRLIKAEQEIVNTGGFPVAASVTLKIPSAYSVLKCNINNNNIDHYNTSSNRKITVYYETKTAKITLIPMLDGRCDIVLTQPGQTDVRLTLVATRVTTGRTRPRYQPIDTPNHQLFSIPPINLATNPTNNASPFFSDSSVQPPIHLLTDSPFYSNLAILSHLSNHPSIHQSYRLMTHLPTNGSLNHQRLINPSTHALTNGSFILPRHIHPSTDGFTLYIDR